MSSDLTSSLLQMFGGNIMDQLGSQLGADPATTQKAVGAALPLLLGALGKNASTEDGASALFNALSSKHDGSVLNDLSGFITKGGDVKDGQGILRHTLGSKQTGRCHGRTRSTDSSTRIGCWRFGKNVDGSTRSGAITIGRAFWSARYEQ